MSNSLGRLVVQLGLDAAEYTKGLSKSEYQAQQWARSLERGVEWARNSMIGFGAVAVGVIATVNAQADKIAAFQGLADQIGDTAEAVASLHAASDLSGTSLDLVAAASVKLTTALSKTDDEAKGVGHALAAIGIELGEFKRLSPVEQIDRVAQALSGYEDGASKTAVAVSIFGKSGADLIGMFNDLAGGAQRQVFLTNEQIAAADAYTKQVSRLSSELKDMATITAADAIPQLSQMVGILQDLATSAGDARRLWPGGHGPGHRSYHAGNAGGRGHGRVIRIPNSHRHAGRLHGRVRTPDRVRYRGSQGHWRGVHGNQRGPTPTARRVSAARVQPGAVQR